MDERFYEIVAIMINVMNTMPCLVPSKVTNDKYLQVTGLSNNKIMKNERNVFKWKIPVWNWIWNNEGATGNQK